VFVKRAVLALLLVGVTSWAVMAQSTTVAPLIREVNSDLMHDLLESIDALMDQLTTNVAVDASHDSAASSTGPQLMGECDDTSTDAVDEGDAGRARVDCSTRALLSTPVAITAGGCTPNSSISTAAVMETEIKATAGQLYQLTVGSIDATAVYAKLYNDTAANTDQTDTPVARYLIAPNTTVDLPIPVGMAFSTAITIRVTTGIADNDTGALTASEVLVSYCYK
jgi:hypothetical protein